MDRLIDFVIFVIVVGTLWWALTVIIPLLGLPSIAVQVAMVIFVLLVVLAIADYFRNRTWFWRRP